MTVQAFGASRPLDRIRLTAINPSGAFRKHGAPPTFFYCCCCCCSGRGPAVSIKTAPLSSRQNSFFFTW
jgi:hypothetical protein